MYISDHNFIIEYTHEQLRQIISNIIQICYDILFYCLTIGLNDLIWMRMYTVATLVAISDVFLKNYHNL